MMYPVTTVRPKAPFVMSAAPSARRLHEPTSGRAAWLASGVRYLIDTKCGKTIGTSAAAVLFNAAPDGLDLCDDCVLAELIKPVVYTLWGAAGQPLYIGHTVNIISRLRGHVKSSYFWPLVASWTWVEYPTVFDARGAEIEAIQAVQPEFNIEDTDRDIRLARNRVAAS